MRYTTDYLLPEQQGHMTPVTTDEDLAPEILS